VGALNGAHIIGTLLPVEEPSTALKADHSPLTAFYIAPVIGPAMPAFVPGGWEQNDAATLWELQIASDAMPLDA
jgi:hypothetical protein